MITELVERKENDSENILVYDEITF